jgi:hypothetical protein
MTKLDHLKACRQFLNKVVNYRRTLIKLNAGKHASENMMKTMASIRYLLPQINNFDRMQNWIAQKGMQVNINELIPSNKTHWKTELQQLIAQGNILQGRQVNKPLNTNAL